VIRLFAALALPGDVGAALTARQHGLLDARWRPIEAFHITLRFFGEIPEDKADDLDLELAQVRGSPLDLELEGVGALGEGRDIHAIWAGVKPTPPLEQLARRCEAAARRAGLKPETRVWRPHATLAYLRRPDPSAVARWLQTNSLLRQGPFSIEAFSLYSSTLGGEGSRYQLERFYQLAS
jgi:2'-5' RNA ligase